METISLSVSLEDGTLPLYSLEKLIEWKLVGSVVGEKACYTLYSLEKLIEWKPVFGFRDNCFCRLSTR